MIVFGSVLLVLNALWAALECTLLVFLLLWLGYAPWLLWAMVCGNAAAAIGLAWSMQWLGWRWE